MQQGEAYKGQRVKLTFDPTKTGTIEEIYIQNKGLSGIESDGESGETALIKWDKGGKTSILTSQLTAL